MKSTSEPLEVHHPSLIKNEFSKLSSTNLNKTTNKHRSRNFSDTHAIILKDVSQPNDQEIPNLSAAASQAGSQESSFNEETYKSSTKDEITNQSSKFTNPSHVSFAKHSARNSENRVNQSVPSLSAFNVTNRDRFLKQYSKKTLLDNWVEDRVRESYENEKREKVQSMFNDICIPRVFFERPVDLSRTLTFNINFMDKFILKCEANTKHKTCFAGYSEPRLDSYLKLDYMSQKAIDEIEFSNEYSAISHISVIENMSMVFKFISVDRYSNENKTQILYGQHFYISSLEGDYYLYSENSFLARNKFAHLSAVFFTKIDSVYSNSNFKWMFVPHISHKHFSIYEYEGRPVDINSCVLIKHVNTGRYLIICDHLRFSSFYELACDSLTSKKYFYTQNNEWRILKG